MFVSFVSLSDTKKSALKWEYDYKRSEEERETMELSIEKLRNDMAKSDTKKKQLLEQVMYRVFLIIRPLFKFWDTWSFK